MRPHTRTARGASLFAASAALIVAIASAPPRGWQVATLAAAAPQQTTRLSFEAEFPVASVGRPYMQSLKASGGAGGYKFAEGGTLPPGMQWVTAGDGLLLRGTPTQAGDYPLRLLVNDAEGQQITRDVTFKVTANDTGATVPVNVNETLTTTDGVNVLVPVVVNVNETLTTTDTVNIVVQDTTSASLTPTSQDFGSAAVGTFNFSTEKTFTLTNTGQTPLNSTTVTLTGPNASSFSVLQNGCTASLSVDGTCSIGVVLKSATAGPLSATLKVTGTGSTATVTETSSLTGTGTPGAMLTVTPDPVSFPSTAVNTTSAAVTVTLTNTGNAQLTLNGTQLGTLSGADAAYFTFFAGNCGYSGLAVSASCSGSLTFRPNAARTFNATLSIPSNDINSPAVILLTGTGAAAQPAATITPSPYSFGTVASGSTGTNNFTVTNTGNVALSFASPQVAAPYSIAANTCTASLAVNATCMVTVAFAPVTTGTVNGTLSLTDTTGDNFTATLSGTGAAPDTIPPVITVPANLTVAATNASGAVVTYTVTANDAVDGTITPVCTPASGSTFALGTTTVTCTATDSHSNQSHASFTVTVQDTTPPVITVPANITVPATSANGAVVTYTATAVDAVDGNINPSCTPLSGSTFALGTTTVTCTATDSHSNQSQVSFTVTVQDTTPPTLTLPANIVTEATGTSGRVVTYNVTATDLVDGTITPSCTPASGTTFPFGMTTVNCTAIDSHNNQSHASFTVTVQDTTPPVITVPANMNVTATSAGGAVVTYTATAVDLVDGAVTPACTPASGSTFTIGTTTVTCTATDSHNNQSHISFAVTVTVQGAPYVFVTNAAGSMSSLYNYNGSVQSSAVTGGGIGAAVDRNGLVFSLTADGTGVSTFNDNGTLANTTSGVLNGASALAIDGGDQLWIAAPSIVSVGQILGSGQTSYTDSTLQKPSGVAIDLSGNVWISDSATSTVHEIVGGGLPTQPLATAVTNKTPGTEP